MGKTIITVTSGPIEPQWAERVGEETKDRSLVWTNIMKIKTTIKIPKRYSVLVVEDNPIRHDWFRMKLPYCEISETTKDAIAALTYFDKFDVIFLDHDTVHRFVDPSEPDFLDLTFWKVAQYLHRTEYKAQIIIHSGNPVGAGRMAALLGPEAKVTILPYGTFDIEVI
jgi:CheY-like chemotaxis protein